MLRDNVLRDVDRLNGLYTQTLENNKVEIIPQRATVTGPNEVTLADGSKLTAKYILDRGRRAAACARVARATSTASPRTRCSTSPTLPKRILIAGGGYIANEFAGIFNEFGTHVTIINRADKLLRGYDEQLRDRLLQISLTQGHRLPLQRRVPRDREAGRRRAQGRR